MDGMFLYVLIAQSGQAEAGPQQFIFGTLFPIVLFLAIMYLILIRPQQKRNKEHQQLISRLKAGDRILTSSGLYGTIKSVDQNEVVITIADNVDVTMSKSAVVRVLEEGNE